jgi:hypothetical protein
MHIPAWRFWGLTTSNVLWSLQSWECGGTMALDEVIGGTGTADDLGDPRETFTVAWWQNRSAEELKDIIKRGFAGGDAFKGAVAEAERRGREATQRLRQAAAVEAERRQKRMRVIGLVAFAALLVLISAGWLFPG